MRILPALLLTLAVSAVSAQTPPSTVPAPPDVAAPPADATNTAAGLVTKGKPATFRVGGVIAGFSEGLQLMTVGETRRMWIPQALAYKGIDNRPKGMLVFDVELLGIPNRAPADVKGPPPDAKKTESGLAYKVLQPGVGGRHPKPTSQEIG